MPAVKDKDRRPEEYVALYEKRFGKRSDYNPAKSGGSFEIFSLYKPRKVVYTANSVK